MLRLAIVIAVLSAALGVVPALIARTKGRDFIRWWVYGALLLPIALPHALYLHLGEGTKRCPYCNRASRTSAQYCDSCGFEFM